MPEITTVALPVILLLGYLVAAITGGLIAWLIARSVERRTALAYLRQVMADPHPWMARHGLGHGAGVCAVLSAVASDLRRQEAR